MWPRTQKAQGLLSLLQGPSLVCDPPGSFTIVPQPLDSVMGPEVAELMNGQMKFPCFGRPCPTTPKHGFVESVHCDTPVHALNLLARTLAADPAGEMILMPQFTGKTSAVANNAGVVWGLGSDGVTSGAPGTYFIPALAGRKAWWMEVESSLIGKHHAVGVSASECHYIELVEDNGAMRAVQLRTGPVQEGSASDDYIPHEMIVKRVIYPRDVNFDLIRWDKLIRNAQRGAVVVMSAGATRFSHYAVHCLLNRVAMVFGRHVEVGDVLKPSKVAPLTTLDRHDYNYLARLILAELLEPRMITDGGGPGAASLQKSSPDKWRVTTAIGTCHAMAGWGRDRHLLRLRATGAVACFAYAASAAIGELRHFYRTGPGSADNARPRIEHTTDMKGVLSASEYHDFITHHEVTRNPAYSRMSVLPIAVQESLLNTAAHDFLIPGWGSSFGGKRWSETASQAAWLGRALISFCKRPEKRRWNRVQSRYNATLHCCHTHGKVLTKWVPNTVLDLGSNAPGLCFMNSFTARCVFDDSFLPSLGELHKDFFKEENVTDE